MPSILEKVLAWFGNTPEADAAFDAVTIAAELPLSTTERDQAARDLGETMFVHVNGTARFDLTDLRRVIDAIDITVQSTSMMDIGEVDPITLSIVFDTLSLGLTVTEKSKAVDAWNKVADKRG